MNRQCLISSIEVAFPTVPFLLSIFVDVFVDVHGSILWYHLDLYWFSVEFRFSQNYQSYCSLLKDVYLLSI